MSRPKRIIEKPVNPFLAGDEFLKWYPPPGYPDIPDLQFSVFKRASFKLQVLEQEPSGVIVFPGDALKWIHRCVQTYMAFVSPPQKWVNFEPPEQMPSDFLDTIRLMRYLEHQLGITAVEVTAPFAPPQLAKFLKLWKNPLQLLLMSLAELEELENWILRMDPRVWKLLPASSPLERMARAYSAYDVLLGAATLMRARVRPQDSGPREWQMAYQRPSRQ